MVNSWWTRLLFRIIKLIEVFIGTLGIEGIRGPPIRADTDSFLRNLELSAISAGNERSVAQNYRWLSVTYAHSLTSSELVPRSTR